MTRASKMLAVAFAALAAPTMAEAQTCLGLAPFSAGRVQIGASGDFGNDAKAFSGSLTFGSTAGAFGGLSVGTISYDDFDGNTTAVGGSVGWQLPLGTDSRAQLCPGAGASYGFGPDNIEGSGTDLSSWNAFFGLQLGFSTGSNPQFRLVPTAGAALAYTKLELEGGFFGGLEDDETYGIITLGLGFVVNSQVSILPSVDILVGLEDADPSFGIMAAINFGRGSQP
jgi:hypothetical protein